MTDASTELGPRLILATMQTAATNDFLNSISDGDHLLMIADEVHQIGSSHHARNMSLGTGPRLGLSATPIRYGDPQGTAQIFRYFGGIVPPRITLFDAIAAGRLVEYEYHPHPVHLTATEADEWRMRTNAIRLEIAKIGGDKDAPVPLTDKIKLMLIQQSRIAKKAKSKIRLAASVLKENFEEGQHWLIYCEDSNQLVSVMRELRTVGLNAVEYHSAMEGDRDATLAWFRSFGGVLVSIKCLDEGVDIPAISHALILASSQNPRQFIQRRGRVLRKYPGKNLAIIHDAIVVPINLDDEPDQTSLLKSELARAVEFANSAFNRTAGAELRNIAAQVRYRHQFQRRSGLRGRRRMSDETDDMGLAALLDTAREVSPDLSEDLLRRAYAIQRAHQFDRERTISVQQTQRLIEEFAKTMLEVNPEPEPGA